MGVRARMGAYGLVRDRLAVFVIACAGHDHPCYSVNMSNPRGLQILGGAWLSEAKIHMNW